MSLTVHTARVSYPGPDRVDVTAKSGVRAFAPSWALLGPYLEKRRAAGLTDADWADYSRRYLSEMQSSRTLYRREWAMLLARSRVVLCCYCTDPTRCHRRLLAELLASLGATDAGEI